MTQRNGLPRLSARSAWRIGAGALQARRPVSKPWAVRRPPPTRLGEAAVPVGQANRQWGNRLRASESLDDAPQSPAAPLLPARWPVRSPARSLWVIINAPWYQCEPDARARQGAGGAFHARRALVPTIAGCLIPVSRSSTPEPFVRRETPGRWQPESGKNGGYGCLRLRLRPHAAQKGSRSR